MRSKWLLIGGLLLVAIIGGAVWAGRPLYQTARIGTAYVAKQTCSCLFIAKRPEASCKTDYESDALSQLTVQPGSADVTVSALGGLVSTKAEFVDGFGCHPAN
jgi:hypothetical protein